MIRSPFHSILGVLALLVSFGCSAWSADEVKAGDADKKPIPYPLTYCAPCGEDLSKEDDVTTIVDHGREIKFCAGCAKKYKKDPEGTMKKVDAAIAKENEKKAKDDKK